jgi:DNA-binding NarL/FixJ family response regulator
MIKIKVMLVDDHQIVRDGIRALLLNEENIEITDEASDGEELFRKLLKHKPDIVIMDISLPDKSGIEISKEIQSLYPEIKVLILSMYNNEDFVFNAIRAGAKGYLPKNTSKKELVEAINSINEGHEYFSEEISDIILKSYVKKIQKTDDVVNNKIELLSTREIEVLKLFIEGKTNQEIADKLFISIRTVESHKNHIMQKLELKSIVDLIKFAIKNKIVEI